MISSTDFRTGLTIEIDGNAWQVVEFQHVKPGKGAAFVRTKIKTLKPAQLLSALSTPMKKCRPRVLILVICSTFTKLTARILLWTLKLMSKWNLPKTNSVTP